MSPGPPIPLHKQAQRICAFCIHFRLKHNPLAQLACHHGSQGHEPYESDEAMKLACHHGSHGSQGHESKCVHAVCLYTTPPSQEIFRSFINQ